MLEKDGEREGLYILMMSIHGLVRAENIELGRDADTGGQITYVIEMAKALAADPRVGRVDLLTRRVEGPGIENRAYALVTITPQGAVRIRGFGKQPSRPPQPGA